MAQNEIKDAACKIAAFDLRLGDLNAELFLDFGTRDVGSFKAPARKGFPNMRK
jgi:hypothetical protein